MITILRCCPSCGRVGMIQHKNRVSEFHTCPVCGYEEPVKREGG
jgi:predicted RNA-binding Zn-ribbon protein involved in translation (DUF1610 family)